MIYFMRPISKAVKGSDVRLMKYDWQEVETEQGDQHVRVAARCVLKYADFVSAQQHQGGQRAGRTGLGVVRGGD